MTDDRPLFDDEDLPDWMKKAGISYAGPSASSAPTPESGASQVELPAELPWLSGSEAPDSGPASEPVEIPDWMHQDAAPALDSTPVPKPIDLPPWMQESAPLEPLSAAPGASDEMPWLSASEPAAPDQSTASGSGLTGALPWRQGASEPNEPVGPPAAPESSGEGLSWSDVAPPAESEPPPPEAPRGLKKLLKPLPSAAEPAPPSGDAPPQSKPPIKPLRPTAPSSESAPGSRPSLRKLPPKQPPPADLGGMTYEEWERHQSEGAETAQTESEEDLLNAVPDWINSAPGTPAPDAAAGPEFMPDWFAGLEEQPEDAAPDWFKSADLSSSSLVGPETVSKPSAPPEPTPAANEAPDWFKSGTVEGLDFDAMFGAGASVNAAPEALPEPPVPEPTIPAMPELAAEPAFDEAALDWMADAPTGEPSQSQPEPGFEPEPAMPELAAADLPDWMNELAPSGSEPPAAPTSPAPVAHDDDLLRDLAAVSPAPGSAAPHDSLEAGDIPEWMRDMAPAAPTPIAPEPAKDIDWLADAPAAATENAAPAERLAPGALPDWLANVQADMVSADAGSSAPPHPSRPAASAKLDLSSSDNIDIDALLNMPSASQSTNLPALVPSLPTEQEPISFDDSELDKLLGPAPEPVTAEPSAPPAEAPVKKPPTGPLRKLPAQPPKPKRGASRSSTGALAAGELPDFVADLRPTDAPVPLTVGDTKVEVKEAPVAQLTDQLRQLRERAKAFAPPEPGQVAGARPLAEIKGTLAAEPIIVQAASQPTTAVQPVISDLQAKRVRMIQDLLEIEEQRAEDKPEAVAKAPPRPAVKVDRLLITLLLLVALAAPFVTDAVNLMIPPNTTSATPEQTAVFNAMDGLAAGQPVLMAFEYGPTGSGELDDLSRVLLRDLFKRGAKPIIVSTNPSGVMHAEALLSSFGRSPTELSALNRADKPLLARADYVILRYLPAGAAGVRSVLNAVYQGGFQARSEFTTDIEGQDTGLGDAQVAMLRNAPILVLAETPEDVRNWAEQYRAPADLNGAPPPKIIMAVSAAADATARTYKASQPTTLIGPLIGLRDATVYRALRQPPGKPGDLKTLDQRWQSTGLGALVAGVIIFLGSMFSLMRALRRRPRAATGGTRR